MIEYVVRQFKRLLVLAPGIILAYISAKEVYPFLDKRIPASMAVLATYIITAYGIIPVCVRLFRLVIKPDHIPIYTTTPDGYACDPVNIGIFGTKPQLVSAMKAAGWYEADKKTLVNVIRMLVAIIIKQPYKTAPFSSLYLFGRSQDIGFEQSVDGSPNHRHHVRFWACSNDVHQSFKSHVQFWHALHPDEELNDEIHLWVGAASLDIGIGVIRHNGQITHMIHSDTDAERDKIVRDLKRAKKAKSIKTLRAGSPYKLENRVLGGHMRTDGQLTVVELN